MCIRDRYEIYRVAVYEIRCAYEILSLWDNMMELLTQHLCKNQTTQTEAREQSRVFVCFCECKIPFKMSKPPIWEAFVVQMPRKKGEIEFEKVHLSKVEKSAGKKLSFSENGRIWIYESSLTHRSYR